MMKFFGNESIAKAMISNDFKIRADGKLKQIEIPKEEAEKAKKERLKINEVKQKERNMKYLAAYRDFFFAPEATHDIL